MILTDEYQTAVTTYLDRKFSENLIDYGSLCSDSEFIGIMIETVEQCFGRILNEKKKSERKRKGLISDLECRKLTQEIIDKYKSSDNLLIHMQDDVEGIAYFKKRTLVGYVGYSGEWIKGIWVHPKYRELHLGSRLLKYAVRHGAVKSSVNKSNKVSLMFHEKNGFKKYRSDKNMVYLKIEK